MMHRNVFPRRRLVGGEDPRNDLETRSRGARNVLSNVVTLCKRMCNGCETNGPVDVPTSKQNRSMVFQRVYDGVTVRTHVLCKRSARSVWTYDEWNR